jgi:antitoxin (DNA-binding transcriptional repressor) of toxin-antitoxin stability system
MIILTVTEAARHFSELVNRIRYQREEATLLKGGRPVARMGPVHPGVTGAELARLWPTLPRLGEKEAGRWEAEWHASKLDLPEPKSKWD